MGNNYPETNVSTETVAAARTGGFAFPALLVAMRPYQWPKNLIVFAAVSFGAGDTWTLHDRSNWWDLAWHTGGLFLLWCLVASATYLINDLRDREVDRLHPRKGRRPIASGAVHPSTAWVSAGILAGVALPLAFVLDAVAGAILAGYFVVMLGYSFGLRQVAILDVIVLCSGVIGRAVSGAVAIDVHISPWLYVCSGFGAFFFAASKRWAEYRQLGPEAARHRPALASYSGEILGQMVIISAASALLSYALYTIESVNVPANGAMALTIPFVAFGLFRYLLLLNGERRTDAPDQILFTDVQILLSVAGFLGVAVTVLMTK
jgi:4-hydroxybenzoate polyprenyltransferase